jgi:hypothetical protein
VSLHRRAPSCRRPHVRPAAHSRDLNGNAANSVKRRRALEDVADLIGVCIKEVSTAHMLETAMLLSIARLDLLARMHGVSEQELDAIGSIVNGATKILPLI